ncbi:MULTISPECIES: cation:proton antiporter [Acinetobacter]|uniref:Cation:proton antiporter n=2 Tax=Acinetobacter calcoaceticus/baumannii complex TaxID=909768 RepID=A0AAE9S8K9_ACIPI|nr:MULTISPECIES: cation:proton antiporter [Acinetobacter calcoaceticus/baumannii complex]OBA10739.1 sodium:proton antiporter [Acinetobacter calcoaceticus]AZP30853.1 sodium:proton antiporter [Acinetobacter pittii]EXC30111.1 sodium/hydrogen exchanger family protein [Acinetobacter sp. 809848]EXE27745.1 sodium/hydrogen exchanger family protein [Acinetobacter sp. 907131]EXE59454.1 sodium/hydrogen exchanger family protein [Acinetobacter sp. 1542444]
MPHDVDLIILLAVGFGVALIFGYIAARLRLPPLIGYLIAGIIISPNTPGIEADIHLANQLAELGVMFLMFGVGMHFSLKDLLLVRRIALPGAILQIAVATLLGIGVSMLWGWSFGSALVFGLSLSCASTVVLLKALGDRGLLDSVNGKIAVGWLLVEDLVMVLVLVLLPATAVLLGGKAPAGADGNIWLTLGITLLKVIGFIAFMLIVGKRVVPIIMQFVARLGSRELFTLTVVAAAVSIAYGSYAIFGVSMALGAFFAGMVVKESDFSHRAEEETLPLREIFSILFFVSVGMLFDPHILVESPLHILAVIAIIMVGKTLAAMALVLFFRYPINTALTVGASLAQIGEFSFILATLGVSLGLLSLEAQNLILAGALFSITLNSFIFSAIEPVQRWIRERSHLARLLERSGDPLAMLPDEVDQAYLRDQVVIVGYGGVGRRITENLINENIKVVIAEENREIVEKLRNANIAAVSGVATEPSVLIQAHIMHARLLVISPMDILDIHRIVAIAKQLNPQIQVLICAESKEEAAVIRDENIGEVFYAKEEMAKNMSHHILNQIELAHQSTIH